MSSSALFSKDPGFPSPSSSLTTPPPSGSSLSAPTHPSLPPRFLIDSSTTPALTRTSRHPTSTPSSGEKESKARAPKTLFSNT
ncbi:hypothetical protein V6N11_022147 [Hibiscus sabdariffa]|uniref:Uncharacterized protein n=1 Tax=Hibiscus sabdariffa TaxID=183260 RepID=A0ABR2TIB0_9ROSI